MSEVKAVANACSRCGNAIEPFSADPGLWAIWISLPGDNGESRPYHAKCVTVPLSELDRLRADNARLMALAGDADKLNLELHSIIKQLEMDNTRLANECEQSNLRIKELEAANVQLVNDVKSLKEQLEAIYD